MEIFKDILWPIVAFGFVGAFIDFLLGKKGQERVKNSFLRWWVQFDDVHWNNFGRKEAEFAVSTLGGLFGSRLFSFRRILSAILFYAVLIAAGYLLYSTAGGIVFLSLDKTNVSVSAVTAILGVLGFICAISVSLLSARAARDLSNNQVWRNLVVFGLSTAVNYIAVVIWLPLTSSIKGFISNFVFMLTSFGLDDLSVPIVDNFLFELRSTHLNAFTQFWQILINLGTLREAGHSPAPMATSVLLEILMPIAAYVPIAFRLLLSALFFCATAVVALSVRPVSLIWRRLVESEKPVFTLLFGGAAALAAAIIEVLKHL